MKIFLSPLFFIRKFCKHCAKQIYRESPNEWIWLYELERMPPLGRFEAGIGFVPDLSILLMFDEFLIDVSAHEKIMSKSPPPWLGQWPEVLEALGSEGALSLVDTREEAKKVAAIRGAMFKKDVQNPAKWSKALMYHDTLMAQAESALGESANTAGNFA